MTDADELAGVSLTAGLTDEQRREFVQVSEEVAFAAGDQLFAEGQPADHLWVLLEGQVQLSRQSGGQTVVLTTMSTPGQWAGGLRAWDTGDGSAGYRATGRAVSAGRMLRVPSAELRGLVERWFPFGVHMIQGIYQTIGGIEAIVRQRESLVALGTLAAGLAHEINNPAAAAQRATEALWEAAEVMLRSLTDLARENIDAESFVELDLLRREVTEGEPLNAGALELADREESVGQWLAEHGVADAWSLASVLATAGADTDWCARVEQTVGRAALGPAVEWAGSIFAANALLTELADSTGRVSRLVASVKNYSQMDRAAFQRADVNEGIESTLVMLGYKLREVTVERDLTDLPDVEVNVSELNQVWTNLIDNAVDAMDGHGELRVVSRVDDENLIVEVVDSGPGMDEQTLARAFEPFFTTKDVGKGTGLGLDISRRIVERHGGRIEFDSSSSGTTARVCIPLERARP